VTPGDVILEMTVEECLVTEAASDHLNSTGVISVVLSDLGFT
jgi:hypothetical protein